MFFLYLHVTLTVKASTVWPHTHIYMHTAYCAHPYTLSPSVCIMFLAWPLFLFAGRAKAEPARQTTTKRRKRKNSASSANSSVGTTASKKRSPATNFSLSSQVPVSISSTFPPLFFFFFVAKSSHASLEGNKQEILNASAAIKLRLFAQMRVTKELKSRFWDKETLWDVNENMWPQKIKRKYIKYSTRAGLWKTSKKGEWNSSAAFFLLPWVVSCFVAAYLIFLEYSVSQSKLYSCQNTHVRKDPADPVA